jgi:hypothetical protein
MALLVNHVYDLQRELRDGKRYYTGNQWAVKLIRFQWHTWRDPNWIQSARETHKFLAKTRAMNDSAHLTTAILFVMR